MKRKIVAISTSPFPYGNNITDGPGYRAWHLFQELAKRHEIIVLSLYESYHLKINKEYEVSEDNIHVKCVRHKPSRIADLIQQEAPDVLYLPWSSTPFLSRLKQKIPTILDYVGVGLLEDYATKGYISLALLQTKLKSFWMGDFFLTAGQRERYYLLGLLASSKKLSHGKHDQADPLIHVMPMTPPRDPPVLKEKVIDKKPGEFVLLVAGAFLPWYDYANFFEALKILNKKGKRNLRVVFMGGNPRDPKFERIVKKMGNLYELRENMVYTGLVPFKQRANYYLLADVAINIPSITIEDELSVRTRVIDYLWANLPIISPAKDEYSATIVNEGAGFAYEAGDPLSMAQTIETIMDDQEKLRVARGKIHALLRQKFNLDNYISPLNSFIQKPYVDPTRLSSRGIASDLFLWIRDMLTLLKR
jgi:glycosyltransferase involved in cell wall biosynthesis